jgi:hypothetical protein
MGLGRPPARSKFLTTLEARIVRQVKRHWEAVMLFRIAGMLLLCATALATSLAAQSPPTAAAITRTVVAASKLPTVTEVPLYFGAVSVTVPPGETSTVSAAYGILYQMSGSTEIVADDQANTLNPNEGLFIAAGKTSEIGGRRSSINLPAFRACASDGLGPALVHEAVGSTVASSGLASRWHAEVSGTRRAGWRHCRRVRRVASPFHAPIWEAHAIQVQ